MAATKGEDFFSDFSHNTDFCIDFIFIRLLLFGNDGHSAALLHLCVTHNVTVEHAVQSISVSNRLKQICIEGLFVVSLNAGILYDNDAPQVAWICSLVRYTILFSFNFVLKQLCFPLCNCRFTFCTDFFTLHLVCTLLCRFQSQELH